MSNRTMYDTVTVANIPSSAAMVAGYVDGKYANIAAMKKRFPHATVVEIAVSSHTDAGQVLDVENGDATPAESVGWVQMRRRAGANPSIYCNASVWPHVKAAFTEAGIPQPHYWIAHWDGNPTVPSGAVAKQYTNHGGGDTYDLSVCLAEWPGVDTPSKPAPKPTGSTYTVRSGDTLSSIASKYHMNVKQLETLNPQIANFNLIYPGEVIHISNHSVVVLASYTVKAGDTLTSIAAKHGLSLAKLESVNPNISNYNVIHVGQQINL